MNVWRWAAVGLLAANALYMVSKVGKPRDPITAGDAVGSLVEFVAVIVFIIL